MRYLRTGILVIVFLFLPVTGWCQSTDVVDSSRFQLLFVRVGQDNRIRARLFRVDRFNGFVSVYNDEEKGGFDLVDRERPADDIRRENQVNYQMAFSPLWPQRAFLVNVNTGVTWSLEYAGDKFYFDLVKPLPVPDETDIGNLEDPGEH